MPTLLWGGSAEIKKYFVGVAIVDPNEELCPHTKYNDWYST